jgi:endonuclease-8
MHPGMPEGHLVHREAGRQQAELAGCRLAASSPQGRVDVAALDGARLVRVEARGKHLFHVFSPTATVHVHLGMQGLWLRHDPPPPAPRSGVRLRLTGPAASYDLIAPSTCEVLDDAGYRAVISRLGPDPLRPDSDEQEAVSAMHRARGAVGAAVLEQGVWSGIGNAWRAELLWLARLDPRVPARDVPTATLSELWRTARRYMALGRDAGQVVSDPAAPDERWVYKRDRCRCCGAAVRTATVGGRVAYWCAAEQGA